MYSEVHIPAFSRPSLSNNILECFNINDSMYTACKLLYSFAKNLPLTLIHNLYHVVTTHCMREAFVSYRYDSTYYYHANYAAVVTPLGRYS